MDRHEGPDPSVEGPDPALRLRRTPPEPEAQYRPKPAQKYTRYRNLTSRPGTSFSAPLVAGIGALVDGTSGGRFGPQQIATILAQTADDLGAPGVDLYYSHGRVNAARAVAQR